jgi:hypothetical protein
MVSRSTFSSPSLGPRAISSAVAKKIDAVAMRYDVQNPIRRSKKVAGMEEREAMFVNLGCHQLAVLDEGS